MEMNFFKRKKIFKNIIFLALLINPYFQSLEISNKAIAADKNQFSDESYIRNIPRNNFYILGPGDTLKLEVTKFSKDINKIFTIDGEGMAYLSRLDRIYVKGLTIQELTKILNKEYTKYVYNPDVKITLIEYRPVKFFIDGEVNNTGFNVLPGGIKIDTYLKNFRDGDYQEDPQTEVLNLDSDQKIFKTNVIFPTLFDVIRNSGGLTDRADLENIEITRINSLSNGGGKIKTNVNLLKSLELQDSNQNIRIMDGDTISIKRSEIKSLSQISKVFKSNLNPKVITVYVGGRVEKVGPLTLTKQASLNDALNISGLNIIKGSISFIREGSDGILDKRIIKYSKKAEKGSYKNPYLSKGDIIYVGKNKFNIASEIIKEFTSPIQGLVSLYGLYKVFED